MMLQDPGGNLVVMDSQLNNAVIREDPLFERYVQSAEKYLEIYFAGLRIKGSADVLSGESLFDIRKQLGEMSTRSARKTLKLAVS